VQNQTANITADHYLDDLFAFLHQAPSAYHAVAKSTALLSAQGFRHLREDASWQHLGPGSYYVIRGDASLIAFTLTHSPQTGRPLRMAGAHSDSPSLKIKPQPIQVRHGCAQLGVEIYGGALLAPWFDRDLSIAGRVSWRAGNAPLQSSLIDFKRPVVIIPSLAIHLDREANSKRSIDKQNDLAPLLMQGNDTVPDFPGILKQQLLAQYPEIRELAAVEILAHDLFFYDPQAACRIGLNGEFISSGRLDNLLSCHALVQALVHTEARQNCLILLNDHEEVGSLSASGARGPFLCDVLERLFPDAALRQQVIAASLFVSVDNAHAVHPNFAGKHDPEHLPLLNHGPVIKTNANQCYATDSRTAALFRLFCDQAGVPCQHFVMRNDLACGSTIGPLTAAATGLATVDVGVPQLAMHSIRETAGSLDGWYLRRALTAFFAAPDAHICCPSSCLLP
jgi:aspartyl aminopeptidase